METKAPKVQLLQNKNLVPYLLVALVTALITLGSFFGGVAYQKSVGGSMQPGMQQFQNGMNPNGGFRQRLRTNPNSAQPDSQQGIDAPLDSSGVQ